MAASAQARLGGAINRVTRAGDDLQIAGDFQWAILLRGDLERAVT